MEQITECLIKKEPDNIDVLKKTGIVILAFAGAILSLMLAASIAILNSMGVFFAAIVIYFAYKLAQTTDVEFEYCIVNGDIDIDRIFAKKRRKRLVSVSADRIEKILPAESDELKSRNDIKKTYFAAMSKKDSTNYAVVFRGNRGMEKVIIADDDKVLLHLQIAMPNKVQRRV